MDSQLCSRCRETKPITEFCRARSGSADYQRYCRQCSRDYRRARYGKSLDPQRTRAGDPPRETWRCSKCGQTKPVSEFYRNAQATKGFQSRCKTCQREAERTDPRRIASLQKYRQSEKWRDVTRRIRSKSRYQERMRAWLAANPERVREVGRMKSRRRTSRKRGLPATLTREEWFGAVQYFGECCAYCGAATELVQEHFVPLSAGGPFTAGNIVPACVHCNSSKRDKMPDRWCSPEAYARVMGYLATVMTR